MSIYGSLITEKVNITPPKTKYGDYETDIEFKGLRIRIVTYSNSTQEQIEHHAEYLEKDFPVFKSNFDKLNKQAFQNLLKNCDNWDMDIKNVNELMKMVPLDLICYTYNDRDKVGRFECWYNNCGGCEDFFGDHAFVVDIGVENNTKAFLINTELAG